MPDSKGFRMLKNLFPLVLLISCASAKPGAQAKNRWADSADTRLKHSIGMFKRAAQAGDMKSVEYLIFAHTFSIGIREDYLDARANIHLYNSIGARLGKGFEQGEEFLKQAQAIESSVSAYEAGILKLRVENWFQRASNPPKGSMDSIREAGREGISEAFLLHKRAADSGFLPSIGFVAKAYRYGVGVEGEIGSRAFKEYFYNRLGARLAGDSDHGREFRIRVEAHENGKSEAAIMKGKSEIETWLKQRPWILEAPR